MPAAPTKVQQQALSKFFRWDSNEEVWELMIPFPSTWKIDIEDQETRVKTAILVSSIIQDNEGIKCQSIECNSDHILVEGVTWS